MTLITLTCLRYVQEMATILGPQNRTQGSCDQDKWGGGKIFVCEGRCCDDGGDQLWACCRLCSVFSARWRKARGYKRWKVSAAVSSPVYTPPSPAASRELQRWYRPVLLPTLHLDTLDYWCWCAVIKNMRFLLFKAIINHCHIDVRYVLRITVHHRKSVIPYFDGLHKPGCAVAAVAGVQSGETPARAQAAGSRPASVTSLLTREQVRSCL